LQLVLNFKSIYVSSGSRVVGQTKYYTEDLRGICRLTFDLVASCRWWALDRVLPRSQVVDKAAGTANVLAVQDIAAPVQVVLDRIVDFKAYPKMVGDVVECGNYEEHTHKNKTQTMKTHLVLKAAIMKFGGYFVHTYYPPPLSSVRSGWCCFLLYPFKWISTLQTSLLFIADYAPVFSGNMDPGLQPPFRLCGQRRVLARGTAPRLPRDL